jgi:hypothetical protein
MSYEPYPAATILIPTGNDKHLFIVITNKCKDACHLLLSITTITKKAYDNTCEFAGGEHEFIKHPSYVYYGFADQKKAAAIGKFVDNGYYIARDDLEAVHFKAVCDGIANSPFVKPWVIAYYTANCA